MEKKGNTFLVIAIVATVVLVGVGVYISIAPGTYLSAQYNTAGPGETPLAPMKQCKDHIDNDGDGKCDFATSGAYCSQPGVTVGDSGCANANDNTEINCNDGFCSPGETATNCPLDCLAGCGENGCQPGESCSTCPWDCNIGGWCGNDICEPGIGEDCLSCSSDCNGKQSGTPSAQFCCGDGAGTNPQGCGYAYCTANGNTCDGKSINPGTCCGNGQCEGIESSTSCVQDCPIITCDNDGICEPSAGETISNCPFDCPSNGS